MASDFSLFNTVLVWLYNFLIVCIPFFVILGVAQLAIAVALWRSEKRTKRLKRGGLLLMVAALMPLALLGLWRGVIRPSMGAELTAKNELATEARNAESSNLRVGNEIAGIDALLAGAGVPLDTPKIIVLNFFATWCRPCLAELPHLQSVAEKYAEHKDILFVVVGREESQKTIDAFVSRHAYNMPFVADPERSLYSEFAKQLIPRTYLIDEHRTIRYEFIGFDQQKIDELSRRISELVDE